MKIVVNRSHGGFDISDQAADLYRKKAGHPVNMNMRDPKFRIDPFLIEVVEELGEKANTKFSKLEVINIPEDVKGYEIVELGGHETVHEYHRVW